MTTRCKFLFFISLLMVTMTACVTTMSSDVSSVDAIGRQSKQLLPALRIPLHPYSAFHPLSTYYPVSVLGVAGDSNHPDYRQQYSTMEGSNNYFGIFPAFSGNQQQQCPPVPPTPKCPVAPPAPDNISTCGGASASPYGSISYTATSSVGKCIYTIVTFAPFNKITVNCAIIPEGATLTPSSSNMFGVVANTDYLVAGNTVAIAVDIAAGMQTVSCKWIAS